MRALLFPFALLTLVACKSHTVIDRHEIEHARAASGDAVVVLGRGVGLGNHPDHDFVACVGSKIASDSRGLRIINEPEFVDALYPWFETATAPSDIGMLEPLLQNSNVRARFDTLNVKYLIWIAGRTETTDKSGAITCALSPAGGGCFGFKSWDDEADYEAALWQVSGFKTAGKISTRAAGTSYVPALILPLPLLARVKHAACESMATQLSSYLNAGQ